MKTLEKKTKPRGISSLFLVLFPQARPFWIAANNLTPPGWPAPRHARPNNSDSARLSVCLSTGPWLGPRRTGWPGWKRGKGGGGTENVSISRPIYSDRARTLDTRVLRSRAARGLRCARDGVGHGQGMRAILAGRCPDVARRSKVCLVSVCSSRRTFRGVFLRAFRRVFLRAFHGACLLFHAAVVIMH